MKWQGHRESDRIEDLREAGGSGGPRVRGRGVGLGGIVIALLAAWIFGINPMTVLGLMGGGGPVASEQAPGPGPRLKASSEREHFLSTVLADTEDVWTAYFRQAGQSGYEPPRLRIFAGQVQSACGGADAAVGPFYCPGDRYVYLDLGFFDTLHQQLGAPGDFAQAYVIAHEVGHHLQEALGISAKVQQARQRLSQAAGNQLSVRLELQADCLAGVWAHHSQQGKGWLEAGDVAEAIAAAGRIGDDVLQRAARGSVAPESFTHGSAEQRQRWLQTGLREGRLEACDTFAAKRL